jgi:hypothetical protein
MSDFDAVLERLMFDPQFAAALSADPGATLVGYRLSADEVALLHSQVTGDTGGQSTVEVRANQSSVFGMLSPLAGMIDVPGLGHAGSGSGPAPQPTGGVRAASPAVEGFGPTPQPVADFGPPVPAGGAGGVAPAVPVQGFGPAVPAEGFGAAVPDSFGAAGTQGFGAATAPFGSAAVPGFGPAVPPADAVAPPDGYHTRVDVDGDGHWDRHTLRGRGDGGVDILVDLDRDGHADFVGHDDDADGLVDSAAYDEDHDGWFEKRAFDDDGDGWLDRDVVEAPPQPVVGPFGPGHGGGLLGANLRLPDPPA